MECSCNNSRPFVQNGTENAPDRRILPPARKCLVQPSAEHIDAEQIPEHHQLIANVVNVQPYKKGKPGELEYEVRWEKTGPYRRNDTDWLTPKDFHIFKGVDNMFRDHVEMVKRFDKSGLTKTQFF